MRLKLVSLIQNTAEVLELRLRVDPGQRFLAEFGPAAVLAPPRLEPCLVHVAYRMHHPRAPCALRVCEEGAAIVSAEAMAREGRERTTKESSLQTSYENAEPCIGNHVQR